MTQQQISYRKAVEEARHNRVTEGQTDRQLTINEEHYKRADEAGFISAYAAATNARANMENVAINRMNAETQRNYVNAQMTHMNYENEKLQNEAVKTYHDMLTNIENAKTNLLNAQTNKSKVDLEKKIFNWQMQMDQRGTWYQQHQIINQEAANVISASSVKQKAWQAGLNAFTSIVGSGATIASHALDAGAKTNN